MTFICLLSDIPEEQEASVNLSIDVDEKINAFEAEVTIDDESKAIFLLRHGDEIKAYVNSCPHTGANLNWQDGMFLDSEKSYIQCTIHGALFEKDSGLCVHGPCARQHLESIDIIIENGKVLLS